MTKSVPPSRDPKTGKFPPSRGRQVLGVTADGVSILRPGRGATHFTTDELRRAIAEVKKPLGATETSSSTATPSHSSGAEQPVPHLAKQPAGEHIFPMSKPSPSKAVTQKPAAKLGRSAVTGQFVLKPAGKAGTVSAAKVRAVTQAVLAGAKG